MQYDFTEVYSLKKSLDYSPPNKDWLDRYLFRYATREVTPSEAVREYQQKRIVSAGAFLSMLLPYSITSFKNENTTVEYVSAEHVLGGRYVDHFDVSDNSLSELLDYLDDKADVTDHSAQARYTQIGNFPVYNPVEGKNRVSLYRRANRPIKGLVRKTKYPKPNTLQLLPVKPFKNCFALKFIGTGRIGMWTKYQILSHEEDKIIMILPFNESIKILEDYGVEWGRPIYSMSAVFKKRICKMITAHNFYRP